MADEQPVSPVFIFDEDGHFPGNIPKPIKEATGGKAVGNRENIGLTLNLLLKLIPLRT